MARSTTPACSTLCIWMALAVAARAGDWPTYRADAARSGLSSERLPAQLALQWSRSPTHPPRPAWPTSDRIHFDLADQPIVVGGMVLLGSSADDQLRAFDLATGRLRWSFFTEGPVRFAPAAWRDRVFVASDDGWVYALTLADGKLLWKQRGGPDDRKLLGNERMISRWPVRGGPVVADDTLYVAAGIWPSDGVYVLALDPQTGAIRWKNDRCGPIDMPQPHGGAQARSGVAPQGYLAVGPEVLLAPTGRAVPAAFRRTDGALQYYHLQAHQTIGGSRVVLCDRFFASGGCLFEQHDGALIARGGRGVLAPTRDGMLQATDGALVRYRWADLQGADRKGKTLTYRGLKPEAETVLERVPPPENLALCFKKYPALADLYNPTIRFAAASASVLKQTALETTLQQLRPELRELGLRTEPFLTNELQRQRELIVAGDEAICGGPALVRIVDLAANRVRAELSVEGCALGLAVADGCLLVSTTAGRLYCFGAPARNAAAAQIEVPSAQQAEKGALLAAAAADEILKKTGITAGICLDLGAEAGDLAFELARRSKLQVIAVEADPLRVAAARERLSAAGLYGVRVALHQADPSDPRYAAYCADLIVSSRSLHANPVGSPPAAWQKFQRPLGGALCLGPPGAMRVSVRGALDGAGSWTHQNADPANTLCSGDRLVKGPLEMHWFRDVDLEIADRHAQGPAPLSHQGCLVAEGIDGLCAVDAYNGRELWKYAIPGLLRDSDGVHHDVGVGDTGSNICLGDDSVFVAFGERCLRLDLRTGQKRAEYHTPVQTGDANRGWGYLAYHQGRLYGSVLNAEHRVSPRYQQIGLRTESIALFSLDAQSGRLLWQYRPEHSVRNNAVAIDGQMVYLIDRPLAPADRLDELPAAKKHRPVLKPGEQPGGTLLALDAVTGRVRWKQSDDVFGTQLAVSGRQHTVLLYYQGVRHDFFRLPSEVGGRLAAFDADSGRRLWDHQAGYQTRPTIIGDTLYAQGGAWRVRTGTDVPFTLKRTHGCGQIAAGECLLLFRSATLGYLDLTRNAGTENFGGIRLGCWINAIPAAGLALVPDGSSKCACSYQMHAWLALREREIP